MVPIADADASCAATSLNAVRVDLIVGAGRRGMLVAMWSDSRSPGRGSTSYRLQAIVARESYALLLQRTMDSLTARDPHPDDMEGWDGCIILCTASEDQRMNRFCELTIAHASLTIRVWHRDVLPDARNLCPYLTTSARKRQTAGARRSSAIIRPVSWLCRWDARSWWVCVARSAGWRSA